MVVAAGLCLAAAMLVPALLGYERYVITGDSMAGTHDRGSLLYAEEVAVADLAAGDVITYAPPPDAGPQGLVTHRIVSVRAAEAGAPVFRTKGDANASADPWRFTLDQPAQARAVFSIPYLGFGIAALSVREVRMAVIGGPALLIALALAVGLWRQSGANARREPESAPAAEG